MKKKIFIFLTIIVIIGATILIAFCLKDDKKELTDNKVKINEEIKIDKSNDKKEEEVVNEKPVEEDSTKKVSESKKETKTEKIESNKNTTQSNSQKTTTTTSSNNKTEQSNSSATTNSNTTTTTEQPKPKPIWEQLGMTEDQYYNKPMYNWEHVDFSVEKYGSEKAATDACLKYGDNYEPYLNGEVSYNCSTVTSASGKYLGEMFYTEKLR